MALREAKYLPSFLLAQIKIALLFVEHAVLHRNMDLSVGVLDFVQVFADPVDLSGGLFL